jgi:cytochrome c peroxidase
VVKFYDLGGGLGIGIPIDNQTLAADRLDFSDADYSDLIAFMEALTDTTGLLNKPTSLPLADGVPAHRKIGGEY